MTAPGETPRFRPGVKFRFDPVRQAWMVLAPEKLFLPDEIAVEVLKRIDGTRTTALIVDDLAQAFQAPRETIETDVRAMLADLVQRGAISL
ncbi:pyrroloquinoline quinone biosynthesis peptide chaperone PqqD [Caulobacter sp. S45]|uniref:pyrroloquinoline quinone biosynthesis peptide chaperone PqqD n=1 Tax=Caulobacter sp. S45 TaxID=1641861 RepID=UPI00131D6112|nr:pyrroloquinoline quinone biosynthesis peptide chaperone PqqD [Caulobacter sp. S45]